jgi:phage terminase large subunit-like protein
MSKRKLPSEIAFDFATNNLKYTDGPDYGKPLVLFDFQKDYFRAVLDPFDEAKQRRIVRVGVLSTPKKNTKTFMASFLSFLHIIHPAFAVRNGKVYCAANSREQAKICFDDVVKMFRSAGKEDPDDEAPGPFEQMVEITESTNTIRVIAHGHPAQGTVFKCLAANAGKIQGLKPHFAVLDEAGEASKRDLFDVIRKGMITNPNALMVAISTQSHDPNHFFSELIREGLNPANPTVVTHMYAADQDCDLLDEAQWFKANPALGLCIDLDVFRREMQEAARSPSALNAARRYSLNQQVNLVGSLVTTTDLDKVYPKEPVPNFSQAEPFKPKERLWLSLDMSSKIDLTALAAVSESGLVKGWGFKPDSLIDAHEIDDIKPYRFWTEAGWIVGTRGRSIDPKAITDKIEELHRDYEIVGLAFDRAKIDDVLRLLGDGIGCYLDGETPNGIRAIKHDQGPRGMGPAIEALELGILNQTIRFDGNPLMYSHLSFAEVKSDDQGNRWFVKPKTKGTMRIDLAVAAAMAVNLWSKRAWDDQPQEFIDPFESDDYVIPVYGVS